MLYRFTIKIVLIAVVFCYAVLCQAMTQNSVATEHRIIEADSFEEATRGLDGVAIAAGEDKLIIMIARRGSHESLQNLNRLRLQAARRYLKNFRAIPEQRVIIAEGESVRGRGRIEVYIDGKKHTIFVFESNRNFAPEP